MQKMSEKAMKKANGGKIKCIYCGKSTGFIGYLFGAHKWAHKYCKYNNL
ncbi:MAG: hypothetical protein IJZ64_00815 [Ruminococcus sp.]|nr:hypothetical protein [Ruminococcus sp.]